MFVLSTFATHCPPTKSAVMQFKMSSSYAIPFGEQGVDFNNARGVVKMAGAANSSYSDSNMFWMKESTLTGVMLGLHRYPGAAVMIPAVNVEQGPYCFVNVHTYMRFECEDGRRRYQDVQKSLEYGDIKENVASSVSMVISEEDEKHGTIVITLTSNHAHDCLFTVVAKTPGQKDHYRETVLGAPRHVDVEIEEGDTAKVWDWRMFLCYGKFGELNNEGYIVDRQTVWEVWTVIGDINTHVFDIKFS